MKINRKRLNNKGFTLIELLAVVVILAVVMGIAMTSVLSSMNSSRKGSLQNSAESTSQIFQNKYAEAMVSGGTANIFGTNTAGVWSGGYNFTVSSATFYTLDKTTGVDLNLSKSAYELSDSIEPLDVSSAINTSFVAFNGEKIVACLVATNSGSYYVGQATSVKTATVFGTNLTFADGTMFACSDEQNSWTSAS